MTRRIGMKVRVINGLTMGMKALAVLAVMTVMGTLVLRADADRGFLGVDADDEALKRSVVSEGDAEAERREDVGGLDKEDGRVEAEVRQLLDGMRVRGERVIERLEALAEIGKTVDGGVNRVAFSDADIQGREFFVALMKKAGLAVRIDAAGNIIGRREGSAEGLAPIVIGSHLDSVPNGGRYDGALGAVAALECAEVLQETGVTLRHPLEVVIFPDEEGGLIGSRGMIGDLDRKTLQVVSQSGKTIEEGIAAVGGDPERLSEAVRKKDDIAAYLEIHIEQGSILENREIPIGVVEGIVGISRWDITVEGFANHAGTTPMDERRDALLAAAQLIVEVNRVVNSIPGRQVGTVGKIEAEPGAVNVIAEKVVMSLELRDLAPEKITMLFDRIETGAGDIAKRTGTRINIEAIEASPPALTNEKIRGLIGEAAKELGLEFFSMPSGAGHDAQSIAHIAPVGMIFIPSVGGISHSPLEFSRPEDVKNGADVLLRTLFKVDSSF